MLINELQQESISTRKILERVDFDRSAWKPHEKSMSFGRLATHIAELPIWVNRIIQADHFDFATHTFTMNVANDSADLMRIFDEHLQNAANTLEACSEDHLQEEWKLQRGDFIISSTPKYAAIRHWTMNHLIHHRGQLSVFLRLLDIPVPGLYGPSADDKK